LSRILIDTLKRVADLRWLKLYEVDYEHLSGVRGKWQFASRKSQPSLDGSPLAAEAVFIVPLLKTPSGNRLVMTREFRVPLGDYEHSFPAGLRDAGEDIETTARRELAEETGLTLTKIHTLSPPVVSSAGMSDESAVIAFVECEGTPHTDNAETSEDIHILVVDFEQMRALRQTAVKFSAKAWLVMLMFEALGSIEWPSGVPLTSDRLPRQASHDSQHTSL
jgi:8-oxo-dGTP pyrophosphatase MutT (NUDIX family)